MNLQLPWLLSELNDDLAVDSLDETIFSDNYLTPPTNPTHDDGDLDGDNDIDFDDLELFYGQFGYTRIQFAFAS